MPLDTLKCDKTLQVIQQYCAGRSNKSIEPFIKELSYMDLLWENNGKLVFFNVPAKLGHDLNRHSEVVIWLLKHALRVGSLNPVLSYFCKKNSHLKLWPMLFSFERHSIEIKEIVSIFSTLVCSIVNAPGPLTHEEAIGLLNLDSHTLTLAFMCHDTQNSSAYFRCVYDVMNKIPELREYYFFLFQRANIDGYRIFDQLIPFFSVEQMDFFFNELRNIKGLSGNEVLHLNLLTGHKKYGHSPLHELIAIQDMKKINLYFNELSHFPLQVAENELLKKNINGYTAIHQGVNNGVNTKNVSVKMSEFFLGLLKSLSDKNAQHSILFGDVNTKPLKCQPEKELSPEINIQISNLRATLRTNAHGNYQRYGIYSQNSVMTRTRPDEANLIFSYVYRPSLSIYAQSSSPPQNSSIPRTSQDEADSIYDNGLLP